MCLSVHLFASTQGTQTPLQTRSTHKEVNIQKNISTFLCSFLVYLCAVKTTNRIQKGITSTCSQSRWAKYTDLWSLLLIQEKMSLKLHYWCLWFIPQIVRLLQIYLKFIQDILRLLKIKAPYFFKAIKMNLPQAWPLKKKKKKILTK